MSVKQTHFVTNVFQPASNKYQNQWRKQNSEKKKKKKKQLGVKVRALQSHRLLPNSGYQFATLQLSG
jgi:hypothetical protein